MQRFQSSGKEWILSTLSWSICAESGDCTPQKGKNQGLWVSFGWFVSFRIITKTFKYRGEGLEPLVNVNTERTKYQITW